MTRASTQPRSVKLRSEGIAKAQYATRHVQQKGRGHATGDCAVLARIDAGRVLPALFHKPAELEATQMGRLKSDPLVPGGVDDYLASCPIDARPHLMAIRTAIREVAPDAIETVSYFQIPGYSYPGYDYNGMFAWFSYKRPTVRLHVRPPVIQDHDADLMDYATTKSIVSFPLSKEIPIDLVKSLVQASIEVMKSNHE